MDIKAWLGHVAAHMPVAGDAAKRARHLAPLADHLRANHSAGILTLAMAEHVGRCLTAFPTAADLDKAIRSAPASAAARPANSDDQLVQVWNRVFENSLAKAEAPVLAILGTSRRHGPPRHWLWVLKNHPDLVQQYAPELLDPEVEERQWWGARYTAMQTRHPSVRWLWARETLAQISQAGSHPRPWLVGPLTEMIKRAEAEGADTTQEVAEPRPYPQRPADLLRLMAAE